MAPWGYDGVVGLGRLVVTITNTDVADDFVWESESVQSSATV